MGGANAEGDEMKLSDLATDAAQAEESRWTLPYPASSLADPPITAAEAWAVDLGRDTTICRWHRGQYTHLNIDGRVYFCPIGRSYWRYTTQPNEFLKPLRYR
jgi:hypothetical protein